MVTRNHLEVIDTLLMLIMARLSSFSRSALLDSNDVNEL